MPRNPAPLQNRITPVVVGLFWVIGLVCAAATHFTTHLSRVNYTAVWSVLLIIFALSFAAPRMSRAVTQATRLPATLLGLGLVATLVYFSGGRQSYFVSFYLLLALILPLSFRPGPALLLAALTGAVAMLPVLYDFDPAFLRVGLISCFGLLFLAAFAAFTVEELRHQELERHRLEVLSEASRLSANLNLSSTLRNTVTHLRPLVNADGCVLYLIDEDRAELFAVETDFDPTVYGPSEHESTRRFRVRMGEGLTGWVASKGEALLLSDAERDPRAQHIPGTPYEDASYIVAPVAFDERILGVIRVSRKGLNRFGRNDLALVTIFANQSAVAITNAWLFESTKELVLRDSITGLYNSRYLVTRLQEEIARSERHNTPVSMLFLDCDGLKLINDAYGHTNGDRLIKEIAVLLRACVRVTDVLIRYAGDEYIVLMPQTAANEAVPVAERIRQQVETTAFRLDQHQVHITVSIGVAAVPDHATNAEQLFKAADDAVYMAKGAGRNRVHLSGS